jgi:hypothetical protein
MPPVSKQEDAVQVQSVIKIFRSLLFVMLAVVILMAPVVSGASNAYAATTAAELQKACQVTIAALDRKGSEPIYGSSKDLGTCLGYLDGFYSGYLAGAADVEGLLFNTNRSKMSYCEPANATLEQRIRVFMKYAQEHPEMHHEDAGLTAFLAMSKAFPCRR